MKYFLTMTILLISVVALTAQVDEYGNVLLRSWKTGGEKITPQVLRIQLTQKDRSFEKVISARSGKPYALKVVYKPDIGLRGEHWKVELREVLRPEDPRAFGDDLIYGARPGDVEGRHYFPREDRIGFFYPYEQKRVIVNGIMPLVEWKPFYPMRTLRRIIVDGFRVVLRTGKIEFDEADPTQIKLFELIVEFENICD